MKNSMLDFKEGKSSKKEAVAYWHIFLDTQRVGYVYISKSLDHETINIFINKAYQRKGVGTLVYQEIPKLWGAKKLYAHMALSNAGSYRAATQAGWKEVKDESFKQRVMVWNK